jgi:hypothetical protein
MVAAARSKLALGEFLSIFAYANHNSRYMTITTEAGKIYDPELAKVKHIMQALPH